jgi:hypothetical protein
MSSHVFATCKTLPVLLSQEHCAALARRRRFATRHSVPPEIRDLSGTIEALSQQINALIEQRETAIEQRYALIEKLRPGVAGDSAGH